MLHGVFFQKSSGKEGKITPFYTNRHVATPILALSLLLLRAPLPSIALLISPLTSLHRIMAAIITTFLLAFEAGVGTLSADETVRPLDGAMFTLFSDLHDRVGVVHVGEEKTVG